MEGLFGSCADKQFYLQGSSFRLIVWLYYSFDYSWPVILRKRKGQARENVTQLALKRHLLLIFGACLHVIA